MDASLHEAELTKDLNKLLGRLDRLFEETSYGNVYHKLKKIIEKVSTGIYLRRRKDGGKNGLKEIDWDKIEADVCSAVVGTVDVADLPAKVKQDFNLSRIKHANETSKLRNKEMMQRLQNQNEHKNYVINGKWRKEPYAPREYIRLKNYVPTDSINAEESDNLTSMLNTPLQGFLGQAYNYDDHLLTEEWMLSFQDKSSSVESATDDEVIRTQIESVLDIMKGQVQDRVCNETNVLLVPPIDLGPSLREVPVWGIDSYTRRNLEIALDEYLPETENSVITNRLLTPKNFIEHYLLPSINAQPPHMAHNMSNALWAIQTKCIGKESAVTAAAAVPAVELVTEETQVRMSEATTTSASMPMECLYAQAVLNMIDGYSFGQGGSQDLFKIHPKGTGVVCTAPEGLPPHVVICPYYGEVYPPYRWCEKNDVVEQAQKKFNLKPTLPDFYNILLERPRQDPNGYGLIYVDASQKANMGSSCSHSCDANCTSSVVARDGKLVIVLTTNRHIRFGEELCMDYFSITSSEVEWKASVCLCGKSNCRGTFLNYVTQSDLQQVINSNCSPGWRYASLVRACGGGGGQVNKLSALDTANLRHHGMGSAMFDGFCPSSDGSLTPSTRPSSLLWLQRYVADNLRFVEYERKALPCALMRRNNGFYTYKDADIEARIVMEQRIQSLVCCVSMIKQILKKQPAAEDEVNAAPAPIRSLSAGEAVDAVWKKMLTIPGLLQDFLLVHPVAPTTSTQPKGKKNDPKKSTSKKRKSGGGEVPVDPVSDGDVAEENLLTEDERKSLILAASQNLLDGPLHESNKPVGLLPLRAMILKCRSVLQPLEVISSSWARISLLCDILVLWANTSNFSTLQLYEEVSSAPMKVVARELGTNIRRLQVFGPPPNTHAMSGLRKRRNNGKDHVTSNTMKHAAAVLTMEVDPILPMNNEHTDISVDKIPTAIEVSVEDIAVNVNTDVATEMEDVLSPMDTSKHQESILPSTSTDDPDVVGSVVDDESFDHDVDVGVSSGKTEGPNKKDILPLMLNPNEQVFIGSKLYHSKFIFWQLMGWYCAGTDEKVEHPDVFGCVLLPSPRDCFGHCLAYPSPGVTISQAAHRESLWGFLHGEKSYAQPWPASVTQYFSNAGGDEIPSSDTVDGKSKKKSKRKSSVTEKLTVETCVTSQPVILPKEEEVPLFGSPMLDVALGKVDAMARVQKQWASWIQTLSIDSSGRDSSSSSLPQSGKKRKSSSGSDNAVCDTVTTVPRQCDEMLAPELPSAWVQCEGCRKWRRVPWHVDAEALEDPWYCDMNTWDVMDALESPVHTDGTALTRRQQCCLVPQDAYDPDMECTIDTATEGASSSTNLEDYPVGRWKDVYCLIKQIYYEAQVCAFKTDKKTENTLVKYHFKGWAPKFDEWIELGSTRIQPHNLFTDPCCKSNNIYHQERWQKGIVDRGDSKVTKKKKTGVAAEKKSVKKKRTVKRVAAKGKGDGKSTTKAVAGRSDRRPDDSLVSAVGNMLTPSCETDEAGTI